MRSRTNTKGITCGTPLASAVARCPARADPSRSSAVAVSMSGRYSDGLPQALDEDIEVTTLPLEVLVELPSHGLSRLRGEEDPRGQSRRDHLELLIEVAVGVVELHQSLCREGHQQPAEWRLGEAVGDVAQPFLDGPIGEPLCQPPRPTAGIRSNQLLQPAQPSLVVIEEHLHGS